MAELDGDEGVGRRGQARAGEADERPAAADPVRQPLLDVGRQRADIRHGDHAGAGIDQLRNGDVGVRFARFAHVGKGLHGPRDVVERREERLRRIGRPAREQADPAPAPALVEKLDGAGGLGAGDLDAGQHRCGARPAA